MIRNIVFDMGGVIITINHQEAVNRFKALDSKMPTDSSTPMSSREFSATWKAGASMWLSFSLN